MELPSCYRTSRGSPEQQIAPVRHERAAPAVRRPPHTAVAAGGAARVAPHQPSPSRVQQSLTDKRYLARSALTAFCRTLGLLLLPGRACERTVPHGGNDSGHCHHARQD